MERAAPDAGHRPDLPGLELEASSDGSAVLGLVYDELRAAARGLLRRTAWGEQSLDPTGLVHEAVARLLKCPAVRGHADRRYVVAAALRAMRRVLVERARARATRKRGGDWVRVPLDQVLDDLESHRIDMRDLDEALDRLARRSPRQAEVVGLRYLLAMRVAEIATHLDLSVSTVEADLALARAWLYRELVEPSGAVAKARPAQVSEAAFDAERADDERCALGVRLDGRLGRSWGPVSGGSEGPTRATPRGAS